MTNERGYRAGFALMALVSSLCASTRAAADDAPPAMEKCAKTLGVVRIEEDTGADWYRYYVGRLGSTAPVISAMVMESNCFVVVERGTGERGINAETARSRGDEARESSTRGKGQQVVADYLLKPEIVMNKKGDSGSSFGGIGRLLPSGLGNIVGAGRVGISSNEASTVMTLVDIRSTVRLVAAQGHSESKNWNFSGLGFGRYGLGAGSAYSNTDEGKMVTAAFVDSYNKLVVAVKNYKAQKVEGGLGNGGALGVQGGETDASKKVGQ
ncbi:peptidoglycan-binding protein [Scleromatobacter humisilvae]|uniref:Peptidoglycan-binding protein n=1 Tax=Scleromatobacter humisilvae TaxID=2897159 RepID=A0A9X1YHJ7_9BURK|nr:peptidoglycan-binding protein [Scleromatobacter humisilvae]MCK9685530.1 peptidoglycan-binding protein [Scleromatobacter humisilvae]